MIHMSTGIIHVIFSKKRAHKHWLQVATRCKTTITFMPVTFRSTGKNLVLRVPNIFAAESLHKSKSEGGINL
jgi:hypothetical protein